MKEGILLGADQIAEELIPWWWSHYSRYNDRPVALVDFGISSKGRSWCQKRMHMIPLPHEASFVQPPEEISIEQSKVWERRYHGPLWESRNAWFKKPQACLLTPFERTLWIDLDCEVCGALDPLFEEWEEGIELGIAREDFKFSQQDMFNSGVILYQQGAPFLKEWNRRCQEQNAIMMGDQDILTAMLLGGNISFKELSPIYNWLMYAGILPGIVIAHWAGGWGKNYIRKFGGLHTLLSG